ncbi:hypothetical protein LguiA_033571 [Lonicera macranthoides]
MADGVFGTPIDIETLKGMPQYRNMTIRRSDLAKVARDLKNAEGKDTNCRQYVDNLSTSYGSGVKTLCTIYNATGDDLTFLLSHDWHGHIGDTSYPIEIKNGQWGGFLHVHPSGSPIGSAGAVVYHGFNNNGTPMDWLLSWSVPWTVFGSNTVNTEVREDGHHKNKAWDIWGFLYNYLEDKSSKFSEDNTNGCKSTMNIGSGEAPFCTAIMTLTGPDPPFLPKPGHNQFLK